MSNYIHNLIKSVKIIENMGWIASKRKGSTGIGKTFEDLLDKQEDNHYSPDYFDIEIKTHERACNSMITLFTKSPDYPKKANTILKDNYGKIDEYGNKILHVTVCGNKITNLNQYTYDFMVKVEDELLRMYIYDKSGKIISSQIIWSFESIKERLNSKLKTIAIIHAESKNEGGQKYYKYNEVDIITGLDVDKIKEAINNGDLKIDIRIGTYRMGKNAGKTHDHGTAFRIDFSKLVKYANIEKIN